jgi:hypothetical protein
MPDRSDAPPLNVDVVSSGDPEVVALLEELTAELAQAGYTTSQTFG